VSEEDPTIDVELEALDDTIDEPGGRSDIPVLPLRDRYLSGATNPSLRWIWR